MKILWLCNIPIPEIADKVGEHKINGGGWLSSTLNVLSEDEKNKVVICFPIKNSAYLKVIKEKNKTYYGIPQLKSSFKENQNIYKHFVEILKFEEPDIIHIWGTEFAHSLSMVKAAIENEIIEKVIISIQGLVSKIAVHYYSDLPLKIVNSYSIRDILKQDNIRQQKNKYYKRGNIEIETLKKCKYVIGRTDWDEACVKNYNKDIKYFFCNEILRNEFYKNEWSHKKHEKYSIFLSQSTYPIKGLHYVLEAMNIIVRKYPLTKLYISGKNITLQSSIMEKIKITSYGKYISKLIKKYDLEKNVIFTGELDEIEMCKRFLKSNAFVSASSIENSPNSVGEAMMLGVPIVASDVGGVKNLLTHEKEGYIYQHNAPYMLAYYIFKIFEMKDEILKISEESKKKAKIIYDKKKNLNQLLEIYSNIK